MGYIYFSTDESEIFGLNFGRGTIAHHLWTTDELRKEIICGKYDLVRMKIKSDNPRVFEKLDALGIPYSLYSIILRNKIEITGSEFFEDKELNFALFDGRHVEVLQQLVRQCITHNTATNYSDTVINNIISREKELLASDKYVQTFNYLDHPGHFCWLIKKGEHYIGYVFGSIREAAFEGFFYGLLPQYRGTKHYSNLIQHFLMNFSREKGLKYFTNDVVFQNFPSLRTVLAEGILPVDSYLNIHLKPLLQISSKNTVITYCNQKFQSFGELRNFILNAIPTDQWMNDFNGVVLGNVHEIVTLRMSVITLEDNLNANIIQAFDNKNGLIAYIQFRTLK